MTKPSQGIVTHVSRLLSETGVSVDVQVAPQRGRLKGDQPGQGLCVCQTPRTLFSCGCEPRRRELKGSSEQRVGL